MNSRPLIVILAVLFSSGCGREPSSLLRQGQLPVYDFPLYMSEGATGTVWKFDSQGNRTSFATGLNNPQGVATDRFNNIYVVDRDSSNGRLLKYSASTGAQTVLLTGLLNPSVVAVDSVGQVYVAQDTPHSVIRAQDQSVVASFFALPSALAIGVSDTFIIGDFNTNTVYWGTGAQSPNTSVSQPVNIAIDGTGRTYVAEGLPTGAHVWRFDQVDPGGGTVVVNNLKSPAGIAVDPVGNVYVAEKGNGRITLVSTGGQFFTFYSPLTDPGYLAFTQY